MTGDQVYLKDDGIQGYLKWVRVLIKIAPTYLVDSPIENSGKFLPGSFGDFGLTRVPFRLVQEKSLWMRLRFDLDLDKILNFAFRFLLGESPKTDLFRDSLYRVEMGMKQERENKKKLFHSVD